jgi:cytochrome c556
MMKLKLAFCVVGMGICLLGCTPKERLSPPSAKTALKEEVGPRTLQEAMTQLNGHSETISKALTSNNPDDAHHSLHDVKNILASIPKLAQELSDDKKEAVKKSVAELRECFDALDDSHHGGPDTPYTKVGDRITAALASLKTATE